MIAPIRRDPPSVGRRDLRKARRWIAEGVFKHRAPSPPPTPVSTWIARLSAAWIVLVVVAYLWSMVGRPILARWF